MWYEEQSAHPQLDFSPSAAGLTLELLPVLGMADGAWLFEQRSDCSGIHEIWQIGLNPYYQAV